jgi:hypothetical protein
VASPDDAAHPVVAEVWMHEADRLVKSGRRHRPAATENVLDRALEDRVDGTVGNPPQEEPPLDLATIGPKAPPPIGIERAGQAPESTLERDRKFGQAIQSLQVDIGAEAGALGNVVVDGSRHGRVRHAAPVLVIPLRAACGEIRGSGYRDDYGSHHAWGSGKRAQECAVADRTGRYAGESGICRLPPRATSCGPSVNSPIPSRSDADGRRSPRRTTRRLRRVARPPAPATRNPHIA